MEGVEIKVLATRGLQSHCGGKICFKDEHGLWPVKENRTETLHRSTSKCMRLMITITNMLDLAATAKS